MSKPLITELPSTASPVRCVPQPPEGAASLVPEAHRRPAPPSLPALDEPTLRAHFADLASPAATAWAGAAIAARAATIPGLTRLHPRQPCPTIQGVLEVLHEVARALTVLTGLDRFSLQPPTLAAAERAALLVARASFSRTQPSRNEVAGPAGSPALEAASRLGLVARAVPRRQDDRLDLDALIAAVGAATVAVVASWLTPSGAFEQSLAGAAEVAHAHGALLCVDATGLAALAGRTRLREAGVDVAWLSLGELCPVASSAALGVRAALTEFLPGPLVGKARGGYELDDELPSTIGPLSLAPGNATDALAVYVRLCSPDARGRDG